MVTIIQNKTNGGYAKGYNDALKNVTEDLLVLLNNDVEVTQNWLQPIINEFKRDDSLIAAQPKILDFYQMAKKLLCKTAKKQTKWQKLSKIPDFVSNGKTKLVK